MFVNKRDPRKKAVSTPRGGELKTVDNARALCYNTDISDAYRALLVCGGEIMSAQGDAVPRKTAEKFISETSA